MTAVGTPTPTGRTRLAAGVAPAVAPARPRSRDAERKLTVAPAPKVRSSRNRVLLALSLVVLFVAVLLTSASQALLVQSQDRLDRVQGSIAEQQAVAEQQRLRLAEAQAPSRIVAEATERLGMVPPSEVVYLRSDAGDDALISRTPVDGAGGGQAVDPAG